MKILVTGASGFLGSHVAEQLANEGHDLRLLLRRTSSRRFLRGFHFEDAAGDVTDAESLPAAVTGVDAVVHTAGLVKARSEAEFYAVNAQGTANLIAAVEQAAPALRRFVYVSSLAAHGPSAGGAPRPAAEPPAPVSAYGRSKLAGERFLRDSVITGRSVIFRPPVIYGPRDPALVPFFRLARLRVAPLLMGGHNRISIVYVEDVAHAIAQATTAESDVGSKTYCPEDGAVHTWRDLLSAIEAAAGRRALRISTPRWAFNAAALASEAFGFAARRAVSLTLDKVHEMAQPHWVCSSEDLRRDLGWSPAVDIREGARLTADWYRRERWI
ncbi:MAG TPA: NAD-dependent epimerase/dehydratase family protein [Dehalococcoidia bacterium]|nr:NAD-dependent epimerase/dehydratase family protein [Dehalococcoidia bacterium]